MNLNDRATRHHHRSLDFEAPLLRFTADYADAVVNAAVLTELKIVDATGLRVDERVAMATVTLARGKFGPLYATPNLDDDDQDGKDDWLQYLRSTS